MTSLIILNKRYFMSNPNAVNDTNTLPTEVAPAATASSSPSNSSQADISTTTTINSMADLKKKAPKVYNAMLEGIAMGIVNQMSDAQARLKKMMDDAQQSAMGA